jgi:hypothetical protein
LATSSRYQRRIVSGVTRPASCFGAAAEGLALGREPATLSVGEAQTPVAELLAQDAVLLLEILDNLALAAFTQPANTSNKNWSGATDIFGDPTSRRSGSAGSTRERRAAKHDAAGWFSPRSCAGTGRDPREAAGSGGSARAQVRVRVAVRRR